MKLNLEKLRITLKTMGEYLFPVEKVTSYFKSIKSKGDLQKFIQQRSAHVSQTTLYGYLKTRIGVKYTAMVDDEVFSKSINIAKWNIYMTAVADCTFYTFSYLISEKNLKESLFIDLITKDLGKSFKPDRVIFLKDLPKTRNMKIMRRVIKSCLTNKDPGDVSTLLNPESVEEIKQYAI